VRLYLGLPLEERHRLTGADGPRQFLRAYELASVPGSGGLAAATPVSPCATYANEDTWVDVPVAAGVALIGDAAGWNDPITGQGLSITLRDVRLVSDLLRASSDWSPATLAPYVEERRERMRRLRFGAQVQSALYAEFGDEARARRRRASARFAEDPALLMTLLTAMVGPDSVGPECFTEERRQAILS
jgi:2-polyprenyl-6-methoxyphenol hydroxylase-like FAD-dependent oxidoreductase